MYTKSGDMAIQRETNSDKRNYSFIVEQNAINITDIMINKGL